MTELLSPAGSYDSLCAAVDAGADAVYIGGSRFGARAYADNPQEELLIRGIEYCHLRGRKIYLTVNTLLKESELEQELYDYLLPYYENGVDGLIVQDLGVVQFVLKHFPGLDVHASTQMTVTGPDGAQFLKQQGLTRIVPARELSLEEVRAIISEVNIEVETFIHGAMCYSYSGQCLFSSMIGGRSGNRGRCAQPCRLPYSCQTGKKNHSGYLLSMKDMCTIDLLPDLVEAGITSLKIEGRMKRPEYTAGVVSIYRKYLDYCLQHGRSGYEVTEEDRRLLLDLYNRGGFSQGYYRQHNGPSMMSPGRPNHLGTKAAQIKRTAGRRITATALEPLHPGDILELADGSEHTLASAVSEGASFELPVRTALRQSLIYRTKNEYLLEQLRKEFLQKNSPVKIKGDLRIFLNHPAILKLSHGSVWVEKEAQIAQPAQNNPATKESVQKQMSKTGGTPFVFEELKIQVEPGVFLPVAKLNELRRDGLAMLEQAILDAAGRRFGRSVKPETSLAASGSSARLSAKNGGRDQKHRFQAACGAGRLNILVTAQPQLEAVLTRNLPMLDTIYLDFMLCGTGEKKDPAFSRLLQQLWQLQQDGIRCVISLPPVFRAKERALFEKEAMRHLLDAADGFLLHTLDELAWIRTILGQTAQDKLLVADQTLYAYNRTAAAFLRQEGIRRFTLPAELNSRELESLVSEDSELIVYGFQPLMHSAQCVMKNTCGCTGIPSVILLKDRRHAEFPVQNRCSVCCNTIYNSVPLQLDGCTGEIGRLAPGWLRLSFTVESREQTEEILNRYCRAFFADPEHSPKALSGGFAGTKGHFKRGVE